MGGSLGGGAAIQQNKLENTWCVAVVASPRRPIHGSNEEGEDGAGRMRKRGCVTGA